MSTCEREPTTDSMISEPQRQLVERTPDGIVISEQDRIVFANSAAGRLCGASSEERLFNRKASELFAPEAAAERQERLRRLLEG